MCVLVQGEFTDSFFADALDLSGTLAEMEERWPTPCAVLSINTGFR